MAETEVTTSDNLRRLAWDTKLFRDTIKDSYFTQNGFAGDSPDKILYEKTNLEKEQGDKITFGIRYRLSGDGVTDDEILEGNEEALDTADFDVELHLYRHAVKDKGAMSRKRPVYNLDAESRQSIKDWGTEKVDKLRMDALFADRAEVFYWTASTAILRAAPATAKAALHATNSKMTLDQITRMRAWVKTGGNRDYIPLRPVKIGGKNWYVLLVSEDVATDLMTSSDWKNAQQYARERSDDNPLFRGAIGAWSGFIIHTHENVPVAADAGASSNVAWAKCAILGQQSLCTAWGRRPYSVEEKFDYQNKHGYAWNVIMGNEIPVFDSKEYGSAVIYCARTNNTGL